MFFKQMNIQHTGYPILHQQLKMIITTVLEIINLK